MLRIIVPATELYDEKKNLFYPAGKPHELVLEHSLVSLSKWESKWKKPFMVKGEKSIPETVSYVECMTITQNVNPEVYLHLSEENLRQVAEYIADPMTAAVIHRSQSEGSSSGTFMTAEIFYWKMSMHNIPYDPCQKWHLGRLIALLNVCDEKSSPPKRMGRNEILAQNAALNELRKKEWHTKG